MTSPANPTGKDKYVTNEDCKQKHNMSVKLIWLLFALVPICLTSVTYSVRASWQATDAATLAKQEAMLARAEAATNGRLLTEIHQDVREVRAAVLRIEKSEN